MSGLFKYESNGKWGFVDDAGRVVVEPRFTLVGNYNVERRGWNVRHAGEWRLIDKDGRFLE